MADISRHPIIKQAYELALAVESLGCSPELTNLSVKASDLTQSLSDYFENQPEPPVIQMGAYAITSD